MILFITPTYRRGVIDSANGKPKLLTPEQYYAMGAVVTATGAGDVDVPVTDADLDELFRAYGACIPHEVTQ